MASLPPILNDTPMRFKDDVFGTCSNMLKGFVQILVSTLLA